MNEIIKILKNKDNITEFKNFKNIELLNFYLKNFPFLSNLLGLIINNEKKEISLIKINEEEIEFYNEKKQKNENTKIDFNPILTSFSIYDDEWFSNENEKYLNIYENVGSLNNLIYQNNKNLEGLNLKNIIFISKNLELLKLFVEKGFNENLAINPFAIQNNYEENIKQTQIDLNSLNVGLFLHDPSYLIEKINGENIKTSIEINREKNINLFKSNSDITKYLNVHEENYKDDLNFNLKGFKYLDSSFINTTNTFSYERCFLILRDLNNNEIVGYLSCSKNKDDNNHYLKINCIEIAESYREKGLSNLLYHGIAQLTKENDLFLLRNPSLFSIEGKNKLAHKFKKLQDVYAITDNENNIIPHLFEIDTDYSDNLLIRMFTKMSYSKEIKLKNGNFLKPSNFETFLNENNLSININEKGEFCFKNKNDLSEKIDNKINFFEKLKNKFIK